MIHLDSYISTTDINGLPKIRKRAVQLDQLDVMRDPGFVEIRAEASSALAPLIDKLMFDKPIANVRGLYTRGDLVTIIREWGVFGTPPANPFHVLRVQAPGNPFPSTEVWLARVDALFQTAWWMQVINSFTPGAVPDSDFDPNLLQTVDENGPSHGTGYMLTENGITYHGYLPAKQIQVAVNEYAALTVQDEYGLVSYEHPVVLVELPQLLNKGDLIILQDGRRLVVADIYHRVQRFMVTLVVIYSTELRRPSSRVYEIPLTGG